MTIESKVLAEAFREAADAVEQHGLDVIGVQFYPFSWERELHPEIIALHVKESFDAPDSFRMPYDYRHEQKTWKLSEKVYAFRLVEKPQYPFRETFEKFEWPANAVS